jgi:extradiol dioxygenase family protein
MVVMVDSWVMVVAARKFGAAGAYFRRPPKVRQDGTLGS